MPTLTPAHGHALAGTLPHRYHHKPSSTHICLVVGVLAILVVTHWVFARRRASRAAIIDYQPYDEQRQPTSNCGPDLRKDDGVWLCFGPRAGTGQGAQASPKGGLLGFVPLTALRNQPGTLLSLPRMDGKRDRVEGDHSTRFARPKSRGVSTTTPQPAHDALSITAGSSSVTVTARPACSSSPRDAPRCLSQRHQSGPPDDPGRGEEPKGPIPMAGESNRSQGSSGAAQQDGDSGTAHQHHGEEHSAPFPRTEFGISRHFSRPPPPPPLTPPTLDSTFFPFEYRRPSDAVSIPPSFDSSFIHQPNPEYGASSNLLDSPSLSSSPHTAAGTLPQRTSYTRSVPIGMPGPTTTASAASSSNETMTSGSTAVSSFSPSSYPQASPLLPPPPPGQFEPPIPQPTPSGPSAPPKYQFVGGPGGPGVLLSHQEIDLQGEIISVVDDAGHGWKRHTRVYGGGVCLACVAAQRRGEGRGGFYGDKVPLEDRR